MRGFAKRMLIPILLTGVLSACDDPGPKTQTLYAATTGSLGKLRTEALAGRAVPVYAMFAPFESDRALAERFTTLLSERDPHLRFEAMGSGLPETSDGPWVLVLNETPQGYTGISACQGKPYEVETLQDRLETRLIICDEAARLVEVLAVLPKKQDDQAGSYNGLLRQAAQDLVFEEDKTPN